MIKKNQNYFSKYTSPNPEINMIGDTKHIDMRATPLDNPASAFIKRSADIVISALLIVLTSPIMITTAVGVKLSGPGPVIFKQQRIGKNKCPFTMYKFRSMRVTEKDGTGWTTAGDTRRTVFGCFIRKYSIDELPQFFNVLLGNMSLVGPRPETAYHVERFQKEIPLYFVRHQVKPGITGLAQINGLRGDTSIEMRIKYDTWYIENWSLWLDIKILLKTVFGGFVNKEEL